MNMNYRLISGFLLLLSLSARSQNPVANPASQVTIGSARFTILTPSLIRMEWNEKAAFEDKASLVFINRNLPVTPFQKRMQANFSK